MVGVEDIPVEQRWEIAAKSASALPLMYDRCFRKALGKSYDEMVRPIWIEAGRGIKDLAMVLGLPSGNARQISETLGVISTISFGPEFKFEVSEEKKDGVIGKVTGCAILNRAIEMGLDPKIVALAACQTLTRSAVENLNPDYTNRLNKSMCSGGEYCEMVIERRK